MLYKPLADRFKDYIAIPKINGYQSIHTILNGIENIPIEVQIRTERKWITSLLLVLLHTGYKSSDDESVSHSRARRGSTAC